VACFGLESIQAFGFRQPIVVDKSLLAACGRTTGGRFPTPMWTECAQKPASAHADLCRLKLSGHYAKRWRTGPSRKTRPMTA
jgi:hypothetical protein